MYNTESETNSINFSQQKVFEVDHFKMFNIQYIPHCPIVYALMHQQWLYLNIFGRANSAPNINVGILSIWSPSND